MCLVASVCCLLIPRHAAAGGHDVAAPVIDSM
jgi:hypothetical protein